MIRPLNNNCLIEVIDEYDGIIRDTDTENVQKGVLRSSQFTQDHLTASTGYLISGGNMEQYIDLFTAMLDKTVYWQEYADSGSKFDIDGKKYVLVPFYRLIGVEE